jgi:hypothetical protein
MTDAANAIANLATFKRTDMKYRCQYCRKDFVKEASLAVHSCEPRKRFMSKEEPGVRLGFHAYLKFYELTQGSAKKKTYEEFAESPYYKAFVKFGRYCVDTRAINPARFTEWLLKQNKKIDYWCRDSVYTEYLQEYLRVEAVTDALARAVEYSMDWAETHRAPSHDCLRYGNTNVMAYAITSGRISPWVIYNCESGQLFLSALSPEQIAMIWPYIDSDFWQKKFKDYYDDQLYAKEILQKAGW